MSDTPGDDQRKTDPWGNPLPSGTTPSPGQVPPAGQVPAPGQSGGAEQPDAWWPGDPNAPSQPSPYGGAQAPPAGEAWSQLGMQPGPAYPGYPGYSEPKTEGMATGALVCGILGLLCGLAGWCGIILGPVGIGLGLVAKKRIAVSNGALKGTGMATAGIIMGAIGAAISVIWIIVLISNPDLLDDMVNNLTTTTTQG